ncbi:hypothetical protein SS50377_21184 [Spironucleus salmonicida]|uniref:Uncharacterized protein n=1 Tax=Spironucleus salmonicida TaxID=348837 RepID=A0A9P8M129_9EUKA|nr:hypothetical protein SS50377_21184 [Spironucleus salmonicida]
MEWELQYNVDLGKLPYSNINIDDLMNFITKHEIKLEKEIILAYMELKQIISINKDTILDLIDQAKAYPYNYQILTNMRPFFDQRQVLIIFKALNLPVSKNDAYGLLDELCEAESRVLDNEVLEETIRQLLQYV